MSKVKVMERVTFEEATYNEDSVRGVYTVRGYFPAGRVRGVAGFGFTLTVDAAIGHGASSSIHFESAVINGVLLNGFIRLHLYSGENRPSHWVALNGRVSVTGEWRNPSDAACRALREVGDIIAVEMMDSDSVAFMICQNTADTADRYRESCKDRIKSAMLQLEEARAEFNSVAELADIDLGATGVKLLASLMAGGTEYGDAMLAANAIIHGGK